MARPQTARTKLANAEDLHGKEPTVQAVEHLGPVVSDEPGQQVGGEEYEPVDVPRPQRLPPLHLIHTVFVQSCTFYPDHIQATPDAVVAADRRSFSRLSPLETSARN